MIVRPKSSRTIWGRKPRRGGSEAGHGRPAGDDRPGEGVSRRRRQGGPSQDRALYTCSCGLAFDALVSTSVDCPHCGRTQAW